jgi:broad specificity phosphatase PhoE
VCVCVCVCVSVSVSVCVCVCVCHELMDWLMRRPEARIAVVTHSVFLQNLYRYVFTTCLYYMSLLHVFTTRNIACLYYTEHRIAVVTQRTRMSISFRARARERERDR